MPEMAPSAYVQVGSRGEMRRVEAGLIAAVCGVAAVFTGSEPGTNPNLVGGTGDVIAVAIASAIVGALLWPRLLYPRARGWLRPALCGAITAPIALSVALIPDAIAQLTSQHMNVGQVVFLMVVGGLIAVLKTGAFFVLGALAANVLFRWRGRRPQRSARSIAATKRSKR